MGSVLIKCKSVKYVQDLVYYERKYGILSCMKLARQQHESTASRVLRRIRAKRRGSVFVPRDFLDLGSREAVDAALGRLVEAGTIRRIGRGVYDFPKNHPRFGSRTPSADAVAAAVARSHNEDICFSGAKAANLLGVSTQVPAQAVYLTDGTNRKFTLDFGGGRGFDICFKRSSRRAGGNTKAGLILRALQFVGRDGVDDATVNRLRASLSDSDVRDLRALRPQAVGWMSNIIGSIVNGKPLTKS
ncbi:MAG: hypothetical protein ACI8TQ_003601 [Planctomycetota bacterium]